MVYLYIPIIYYGTTAVSEAMGLFISYSASKSPDILPAISKGLGWSIFIDYFKLAISLLAIIFLAIAKKGMEATARLVFQIVAAVFHGLGLIIGIALCVYYEMNYESTDMASTPWLSTYYYIGVLAYAIMKNILFCSACYYFYYYVEGLKSNSREYMIVSQIPQDIEMPQYYQHVPSPRPVMPIYMVKYNY